MKRKNPRNLGFQIAKNTMGVAALLQMNYQRECSNAILHFLTQCENFAVFSVESTLTPLDTSGESDPIGTLNMCILPFWGRFSSNLASSTAEGEEDLLWLEDWKEWYFWAGSTFNTWCPLAAVEGWWWEGLGKPPFCSTSCPLQQWLGVFSLSQRVAGHFDEQSLASSAVRDLTPRFSVERFNKCSESDSESGDSTFSELLLSMWAELGEDDPKRGITRGRGLLFLGLVSPCVWPFRVGGVLDPVRVGVSGSPSEFCGWRDTSLTTIVLEDPDSWKRMWIWLTVSPDISLDSWLLLLANWPSSQTSNYCLQG